MSATPHGGQKHFTDSSHSAQRLRSPLLNAEAVLPLFAFHSFFDSSLCSYTHGSESLSIIDVYFAHSSVISS